MPLQDGFVNMQLVFSLIPGHALRPFQDFVGDLFLAVGRQAMEDDRLRLGLFEQPGINEYFSNLLILLCHKFSC